ncbi:MAG: hypothetical protein WCF57_14765 [Pyrinomonadaceae bacterium]
MNTKRTLLVLIAAVLMMLQVSVAQAQRRKIKIGGPRPVVENQSTALAESEAPPAQAANSSTPQAASATAVEPIIGSWEATFTSVERPLPYPPIPALLTFTADGTVVETDGSLIVPVVNPDEPTLYASPSHGVWRKIGTNLYEVKFESMFVNSEAKFLARGVVTARIRIDPPGDTFRGTDTFQVFNPDGTPTPDTAQERNKGKRIKF